MNIRNYFTVLALSVVSANSFAQYEGTSFDDRIGHGKDSLEVRQQVSLFGNNVKEQKWEDAYENYKFIIEKAPFARLDTYTKGVTVLSHLISNSQDATQRKNLLDEMLGIYDKRIENMVGLNSFSKLKTTKGSVLCRKAYDYAVYAPSCYADYTLDKAYDNFSEGINLVNEDPSVEVEAFVLSKYFETSYAKYQADQEGFQEQFLLDYILCKEVCEKMLAKANEAEDRDQADKIVKQYDPILQYVTPLFLNTPAASRDNILDIYNANVGQRKDDVNYLRSALSVLAANYCDDSDIYFQAAKYADAIEPDYNSCIGMAQYFMQQGNEAEGVNYYNKAVELCQSNKAKADAAYNIANTLGRFKHTSNAEPFLTMAEQYESTYQGKCDLYRARRDASEKKFDSAISYAQKAADEDPSISGTASRLAEQIADYKVSYQKYEEEQAEIRRQQEAWRKQQAELERQRQQQIAAQKAAAQQAKTNEQKKAQEAANAKAKAEYDKKMAEYNKKRLSAP